MSEATPPSEPSAALSCTSSRGVWTLRLGPRAGAGPAAVAGDVALDGPAVAELRRAVAAAVASGARSLVIESGVPGVFCRGMDLARAAAAGTSDGAAGGAAGPGTGPAELDAELDGELDAELLAYAALLGELRAAPLAVIALVEGEARGGGVGLAAAADCVLATPGASFGLPEIFFGLMPAMVYPMLAERVGPQRARWFALRGATLDAEAAEAAGLVDELVDTPEAARRRLRSLLKALHRAAPHALAGFKRHTLALGELGATGLRGALEAGARQTARDLRDPRTRTGLRAFLEGSVPPWFARTEASAEASSETSNEAKTLPEAPRETTPEPPTETDAGGQP